MLSWVRPDLLLSSAIAMELSSLPIEIILSSCRSHLGSIQLEGNPQPGATVEVAGQTYVVLERRHRYLLMAGRYRLHKITLYVQKFNAATDKSFLDGHWVIGDPTCQYNARSELLRCAVNPAGSCEQCTHYQPHVIA